MRLLALLLTICALCSNLPAQSCVAIDADKLRPAMAGRVLFLWGQAPKFWEQRSTLRIRFLDGSRTQHEKAWQRFQKVDSLVNLTFARVTQEPSEIRVSFSGAGHWSYLGRDALTISQTKPTMNLQLASWAPAREWDRVALHEMLHAIGFDHEQAHPSASIPWNRPAVYAYYARTQGWSKAMVDRQVLNRYTGPNFMGSAYDKRSIQQYPIDRSHVTDARWAVGMNYQFSSMDLITLPRIYP